MTSKAVKRKRGIEAGAIRLFYWCPVIVYAKRLIGDGFDWDQQ